MNTAFISQTPIVKTQKIEHSFLLNYPIQLFIRREDLIDQQVSGNKFRKLKYNLLHAKQQGFSKVLTFGGAYSNHIAATAYACSLLGIKSIGVIRGDELSQKWMTNPTLKDAHEHGMQFHFVSRQAYKNKTQQKFIEQLHQQFGHFYLIPEGGTNALAIKGCEEILTDEDINTYDIICCAVGTGGTLAGIINKCRDSASKVIGFSALNAPSLVDDIRDATKTKNNWHLNFDYTFGGYGKTTSMLLDFMDDFHQQTKIPTEPIYTGKMLFGIFDLIQKGYFKKDSKILAIHTGGLQGLKGFRKG